MLATTSATFLMTDKWTRSFLRSMRTQFPPTLLFIPAACCTACNHLMINLDLSQQIACTLPLVATSVQESPASPAEPLHPSSGWIYIQGFPFRRLVATSQKENSSSPAYGLNGRIRGRFMPFAKVFVQSEIIELDFSFQFTKHGTT